METLKKDDMALSASQAAAIEFSYGDVIGFNWILDKFELSRPERGTHDDFKKYQFKLMAMIEAFKEYMLEEHKMHLVSKRGDGYLICNPNQQSDVAINSFKKTIRNEMGRAVNILQNINHELLSSDEINKRDAHLGKIAALRAFSSKTMIDKH